MIALPCRIAYNTGVEVIGLYYAKDLSKLVNCTIKKPMLDDLMHIPEFEQAVSDCQTVIDDAWVGKTLDEILQSMAWADGKEPTEAKTKYIEQHGIEVLRDFKAKRRSIRQIQRSPESILNTTYDNAEQTKQIYARELDRILRAVRKGWKACLQELAAEEGKSLNRLILDCVAEKYGVNPYERIQ